MRISAPRAGYFSPQTLEGFVCVQCGEEAGSSVPPEVRGWPGGPRTSHTVQVGPQPLARARREPFPHPGWTPNPILGHVQGSFHSSGDTHG